MTEAITKESKSFLERNPGIDTLFNQAEDIAESLYSEDKIHSLPSHGVIVFGLVATAYEIFHEILCLATNDFGRGAQARLRTMYEHVAVAAYLTRDPEQAERFIKFQIVEQRKELLKAREVLNKPGNEEFIFRVDTRLAKLNLQLQSMKEEFGKEFARSWHDGMATISTEIGCEHHFFYNYLIPNRHVHASPLAMERRVTKEDRIYFSGEPDHDSADEAVRGALSMLGLSFAVAKDAGLPAVDEQVSIFTKSLIKYYEGKPNKTNL